LRIAFDLEDWIRIEQMRYENPVLGDASFDLSVVGDLEEETGAGMNQNAGNNYFSK